MWTFRWNGAGACILTTWMPHWSQSAFVSETHTNVPVANIDYGRGMDRNGVGYAPILQFRNGMKLVSLFV
jgi:hypothetical protein